MNEKFVEHLIVFILVYEINWWNKTFSILIFLGNIRQAKKKKDQSNDENDFADFQRYRSMATVDVCSRHDQTTRSQTKVIDHAEIAVDFPLTWRERLMTLFILWSVCCSTLDPIVSNDQLCCCLNNSQSLSLANKRMIPTLVTCSTIE